MVHPAFLHTWMILSEHLIKENAVGGNKCSAYRERSVKGIEDERTTSRKGYKYYP
jgi:hypothetical protein